MHISPPEPMHTAPALAAAWGVSRRSIFCWMQDYRNTRGRRGLGPAYRLGRAWCIPASAAARFLHTRRLRIPPRSP